MQGIITIYVLHAEEQINLHVSNGTQHEISRRAIEHEIMHELDSYSFPIDMKLSWYNTVCNLLFLLSSPSDMILF